MGISAKPVQKEHFEDVDLKHQEETLQDGEEIDINDVAQNKKLNRRLDLRVLPLCCWVYLLNFLDRGELLSKYTYSRGHIRIQRLIAYRKYWQCPRTQRRDER